VAVAFHGPRDISNISCALFRFCQKVKYRPVVPDIVGAVVQFRTRDIGDEPLNPASRCSHSILANVDRGLGNVKNADVLIASR